MIDYFWLLWDSEVFIAALASSFLVGVCFVVGQRRKFISADELVTDLIDNTPYGLVYFDGKEQFKRANQQALRFIPFLRGKKPKSLSLDRFLDYVYDHAIDCDESLRNVINFLMKDCPFHEFREVVSWGDGRICLVEAQKTTAGRTAFLLKDVSHLREHEENFLRVNQSNYELGQAVEAATIGIIISDPKQDGNPIVFVNDALCRFVDLPREDIVGNAWSFVLDAWDNYDAAQSLFQAMDEGQVAASKLLSL